MSEEEDADGGEKLQVDRKRLEAMITGHPVYGTEIVLPNAKDFFEKVEALSGATVLWPNQLKIGAKTKKDPFVKIIGNEEQTESARQLISATLQRRRDRVTLKILLPHESHSHVIGRGGRGSKRIMHETSCHIHFPDSNRYSSVDQMEDSMKSDQVSITGSPPQVERARIILRSECLIVVSFEVPWYSPSPPPMPTLLPQVTAAVIPCSPTWIVSLRAPEKDTDAISECIDIVVASIAYHFGQSWTPELRSDMRLPCARAQRNEMLARTEDSARFENVRIELSPDGKTIFMLGSLQGIMKIRQLATSFSPVSLSFDCRTNLVPSDIDAIQSTFDVEITAKRKTGVHNSEHTVIIIRSIDDSVESMFRARERVLGLEETPFKHSKDKQVEEQTSNENISLQFDYSIRSRFSPPEDTLLRNITDVHSDLIPSAPQLLVGCIPNGFTQSMDAFRSPDPEDSPIAHSLLKSAKEMNKNAELWKEDNPKVCVEEDGRTSRQQMMMKANRAVLDASFHHLRYPTDLWSGYGFSASLPAELIKAALDQQELQRFQDEEEDDSREGPSEEPDEYARQAARKMFSPSQGGLASVLEDEELDSNAYNSSTLDFSRKQRIPSIKKRPVTTFSASSSLFESTPNVLSNDLPWDVDVFIDPAMVLAQIGCSEYLPQFRAHEMDMRALLLSDEQSLKEIGVSTVGARKKIGHAILKLRDSARAKGYDV